MTKHPYLLSIRKVVNCLDRNKISQTNCKVFTNNLPMTGDTRAYFVHQHATKVAVNFQNDSNCRLSTLSLWIRQNPDEEPWLTQHLLWTGQAQQSYQHLIRLLNSHSGLLLVHRPPSVCKEISSSSEAAEDHYRDWVFRFQLPFGLCDDSLRSFNDWRKKSWFHYSSLAYLILLISVPYHTVDLNKATPRVSHEYVGKNNPSFDDGLNISKQTVKLSK